MVIQDTVETTIEDYLTSDHECTVCGSRFSLNLCRYSSQGTLQLVGIGVFASHHIDDNVRNHLWYW
ncbi:hypothetical protein E2C01_044597 [Portunus trituberculatus]|uniref:Uncharacterized protein n=1 Tax=Portunus trituberculatus TaxID=210409 RepID=A0A5B7FYT5_PORTR|nr:hypothetical protein [Portunus trituberculatus]